MTAVANLFRPLEPQVLRQALEGHGRYLAHRTGRRANLKSLCGLSSMTLDGIDLREADLTSARLSGASLSGPSCAARCCSAPTCAKPTCGACTLKRADLRGASLRGANPGRRRPGRAATCARAASPLQDELDGFRISRHERRPGELNYAVLAGADLTGPR